MNRRGQALIEFVLILPIFIFLVFTVYDFGMIYSKKSSLENQSSDIISLYKSGKSLDAIRTVYPDIDIRMETDGDFNKLKLTDNVKIITPGLNRILGNPHKIIVERYLPNES